MYVCYLHIDVWKEELAAEFVVYVITPGLRLDQDHWNLAHIIVALVLIKWR